MTKTPSTYKPPYPRMVVADVDTVVADVDVEYRTVEGLSDISETQSLIPNIDEAYRRIKNLEIRVLLLENRFTRFIHDTINELELLQVGVVHERFFD